jgi:hypothetical protein
MREGVDEGDGLSSARKLMEVVVSSSFLVGCEA